MHGMTMEKDNSMSSSEGNPEHSSSNETVQNMDLHEKSSSNSEEENSRVGLADRNQKASSSGLSKMDDQLKYFARHSKGGATGYVSSEKIRHRDQDSQLSTDKPEWEDEKTEKFERNLEKFLKEREPLKGVQLRKKTKFSVRVVRSAGEMVKIDYCGDMLKLSSTFTNTETSSASPELNRETEVKQNFQTEKLSCVESSKEKMISKDNAQTSDIFKKDADGTENSPTRALDLRLRTNSEFKVPLSPVHKMTNKFAEMVPTGSNKDVTSVQRRPTHFNLSPRKAFYRFSPGSSSEVLLRQCQSLPDVNRSMRKDKSQRRSINFEEQFRIIRRLFKEKPEPATPESKVSTFYGSIKLLEKTESTENAPEEEVPKTFQNIPPKTCRKLDFGSCSKETPDKNQKVVVKKVSSVAETQKCTSPYVEVPKTLQNHPSKSCKKLTFGSSLEETTEKCQQTGVSFEAESPSKRKNASPVEAQCSISSKKVRTSLGTKVEESGNGENVRKNESPVGVGCPISAKKDGISSETKLEEGGNNEYVNLIDVGCSTYKKVKTSSGIKIEGNGKVENARKNESLIDVECSLSDKKVKTSSEKILESGSGKNVKEHARPANVGSSISAKKVRTFSTTKVGGSG